VACAADCTFPRKVTPSLSPSLHASLQRSRFSLSLSLSLALYNAITVWIHDYGNFTGVRRYIKSIYRPVLSSCSMTHEETEKTRRIDGHPFAGGAKMDEREGGRSGWKVRKHFSNIGIPRCLPGRIALNVNRFQKSRAPDVSYVYARQTRKGRGRGGDSRGRLAR